jgi:hypothetical protein
MLQLPLPELIGTIAAALLTIMVLSYLAGDNPMFRLAVHIFVGVAAGYAGAAAWHGVLRPALVEPVRAGGLASLANPQLIVPWLLILMLVFKVFPATARAGSLPIAMLVGVAAAVTVGGAITGTVVPQALTAAQSLSPAEVSPLTGETGLERSLNVAIVLAGTVATLFYFRFSIFPGEGASTGLPRVAAVLASAGQGFVALTYGAMFAGALSAALVVLAERVQFVWGVISGLLTPG